MKTTKNMVKKLRLLFCLAIVGFVAQETCAMKEEQCDFCLGSDPIIDLRLAQLAARCPHIACLRCAGAFMDKNRKITCPLCTVERTKYRGTYEVYMLDGERRFVAVRDGVAKLLPGDDPASPCSPGYNGSSPLEEDF